MHKFINRINVTKAFLPPMNEYIERIKSIWENNWLTNNGQLHEELESRLSKYLKSDNVTLFTSGHTALEAALKLFKLKGEVITTPFTFASTTHAVVNSHLIPVFCDIKSDDFTIDENIIEDLITEKTCAIVPVHVFGYPCNVKAIERIAKAHNLKVIYDAAHAFGVEIYNRGIGTFGDISMFSMHATKVYNTIEGGLLICKDKHNKTVLDKIKNFGITDEEKVDIIGFNGKMNEFQAAMGLVNLKYINEEIQKRKKITEIYRQELSHVEGITFSIEKPEIKYNYSYFPIIIDERKTKVTRDELYEKLKETNVFTRKYFYPLTTQYECYKNKFSRYNLKNAEYITERVLTLPIYGALKEEEVYNITGNIKEIIYKGN